ncbi:alpha/beta hydrolase [Sphingobium mellinum]|uniref:alpha/beta hydrolase n=1 Tax=Sphingobium mellinum TaxID=1387166 RepID=UPI0030ED9CA2
MPLDPVLQQLIDQMPIPKSDELDIAAYRASSEPLRALMIGPDGLIPVASIEDRTLAGPRGDIAMKIYRPSGDVRGTLHHFYGGGWSTGSIDLIDPIVRRMVRDLSMVVVTSSYRLAPENPFPAGLDDSLVAARWTLDHVGELGGGGRPVVVSGESAGANLAAVVALVLRDERPGRSFDAQLLVNPAVDLRDSAFERASVRADADPMLRSHSLRQLYPLYSAGHDRADPRLSPLAADDLSGLPPAVIAVLTADPLRDEAVEYAERLRASGVPVELMEFGDLGHGFTGLTVLVPAADRAFRRTLAGLQDMLARTNAVTARA